MKDIPVRIPPNRTRWTKWESQIGLLRYAQSTRVYQGIRLTPAEIVEAAREEGAHVVGLSVLSGSHMALIGEIIERMHAAGLDDVPVVVGGIIPEEDAKALLAKGVARVYTPKDFELNRIMADIVALVGEGSREAA